MSGDWDDSDYEFVVPPAPIVEINEEDDSDYETLSEIMEKIEISQKANNKSAIPQASKAVIIEEDTLNTEETSENIEKLEISQENDEHSSTAADNSTEVLNLDSDATTDKGISPPNNTVVKPKLIKFGGDEADVIIVVGEQEFSVQKKILAEHSDVFERMFYGHFREATEKRIELKEINPLMFQRLLELFYTKTIDQDNFLLYPGTGKHLVKLGFHAHGVVVVFPGESFTGSVDAYKFLEDFWDTVEDIQKLADRFNVTDILKECLSRTTTTDIQMVPSCVICFNALIFSLEQGGTPCGDPDSFHEETFAEYRSFWRRYDQKRVVNYQKIRNNSH